MEKKLKKVLAGLFIISFLVFLPLQITHSAGAIVYTLKEFGLDLIARVFARNFLNTIINSVSDFIEKNGRNKLPAFVQDWRYFLEDAQYRGEDITRAIIGEAIGTGLNSGTICNYLKGPLGSAFGAIRSTGFSAFNNRVDSLQYYALRNRCTLPAGFDVNTFRNDFSAGGGWAAWDQLIQPQNNLYGVLADSLAEISGQREFEEKRDRSEAEAGSGFTSKLGGDDNGCSVEGGNSFCLVLGSILTPAKVLESVGSKLNTSELDFTTGCDELSECIFSILGALTSRLANFASSKVTDQFNVSPEDKAREDALLEKSKQDCINAKEPGCAVKATVLVCDADATAGTDSTSTSSDSTTTTASSSDSASSSTTNSSGDSATSINCVEKIDQGIYDSCMQAASDACTIQ